MLIEDLEHTSVDEEEAAHSNVIAMRVALHAANEKAHDGNELSTLAF